MAWTPQIGAGSSLTLLTERPDEAPPLPEIDSLSMALPVYQQIMGLDREAGPTLAAAGLIQAAEGQAGAAEWLLRRSLKVAPTVVAHNHLGHILLGRRQWDEAVNQYRASLLVDPENTSTWPNLLFALDLHPWATPELRLAERRRFNALHCKPLTDAAEPHLNDPDPERVLKVGYVSADFKQHSALHGFGPLLRDSRSNGFEIHLYDVDLGPLNPEDRVAQWCRTLEHATWHDVQGYDDATLAAMIRADGIDILVDLSGYSAGGRPLMLARKPAPIQISGFGYATGLGIDAMDYLVADDVLVPARHEGRYHERILRLPSFMGYEPAPPWPDISPPPKARNGYVTYGYLGRIVKLSPQTLAAWAQILTRDPTARLLLKGGEYDDPSIRDGIVGALAALGVERGRLEIRPATSRPDHLAAYGDVDVALDPFPHNGGVTTVEALLMGVPVIALLGDYICGRVAASLLTTLGFAGAVARTPREYVEHALAVAAEDWPREQRAGLRHRVCTSILFDHRAYADAVEAAYREVWRAWCAGRQTGAGD